MVARCGNAGQAGEGGGAVDAGGGRKMGRARGGVDAGSCRGEPMLLLEWKGRVGFLRVAKTLS